MTSKDCKPRVNLSLSHSDGVQENDNNNHCIIHSLTCNGFDYTTLYSNKHGFTNITFFRFLPSVNNYYKVLKALTKLEYFTQNKWIEAFNTSERVYNILTKNDIGFREVVAVFKEHNYLEEIQTEDVEEIQIHRTVPQINPEEALKILSDVFEYPPKTKPKFPEFVEWITIKASGEEKLILSFFDEGAATAIMGMANETLKKC